MLPREIQTRRLWLRPVEVPDAEPLSPILNEISVGRNMTQTPHPCDPEIARSFTVQSAGKPGHWTVEDAGGVIGWCKHDRVLSYLLAPSAWGQGYASELSRAVIASVFQVEAPNQIRAGHRIDNGASARVLAKQGMRGDGYLQRTVMATGERAVFRRMSLRSEDWQTSYNTTIHTERLTLSNLRDRDATTLSLLGDDIEIARQLAYLPHPFTIAAAHHRIGARRFFGWPGFTLGIRLKDGTLIGEVGLGPEQSLLFWLGRGAWGQGFATEAVSGFLALMMPRLGLQMLNADAFADNAASLRVLQKLGFLETGNAMGESMARRGASPTREFQLTREAQRVKSAA